MISLWIESQQKETCKELGIKYPEIWNAGYDVKIPKTKQELKESAQKHKELYIQFEQMYIRLDADEKKNYEKLDKLLEWYKTIDLGHGLRRSISNPNIDDSKIVQYQLKKRKISGFTVDQVFEYWKNREDSG